jgi:hypothetical protein
MKVDRKPEMFSLFHYRTLQNGKRKGDREREQATFLKSEKGTRIHIAARGGVLAPLSNASA